SVRCSVASTSFTTEIPGTSRLRVFASGLLCGLPGFFSTRSRVRVLCGSNVLDSKPRVLCGVRFLVCQESAPGTGVDSICDGPARLRNGAGHALSCRWKPRRTSALRPGTLAGGERDRLA